LKALTLPDGGIIDTLKLNALSTLSMSNLTMLKKENIFLDDDVEGVGSIFTTINNLTVKNCPAMDEYSYRMALEGPMTNYALTGFNWTITSIDDLVVENDKVIGIKVVDKLMTKLPNGGKHSAALVGNIHIDIPTANIDEYDIYKKYSAIYPNLIITYGNITGLDPAVEIIFMNNDTEEATTHYRVLGSGETDGDSIGVLISENGPTGEAIKTPSKTSIVDTDYIFTGYWTTEREPNLNSTHYYIDGAEFPEDITTPTGTIINFNNVIPENDMVFYPKFEPKTRTYTVQFKFDLETLIESYDVPYG
jgi:hypothetical protein